MPPSTSSTPLSSEPFKGVILLVDDDVITLEMSELFLRDEGFNTVTANTLKDAIDIVEGESLDLVVSDIGLPDGSGFELIEVLNRHDIKAIAVSGFDGKSEQAIKRGFKDFLSKPVDLNELLESIRQQLTP